MFAPVIQRTDPYMFLECFAEMVEVPVSDLARDLDLLLEARAEAERLVELCPDAAEGMKDFEKKYIRSEEVTGSRLSRSLSLIS